MRKCSLCKEEKPLNEFSKGEYRCRECNRKRGKEYREKYPDRIKKSQRIYNKTDKAKAKNKRYYDNGGKEYQQKWQTANREKCREASRKHYRNNVESERERNAKYRAENPEKVRETSRKSYYRHHEKSLFRSHLRRHEKFAFLVTERELKKLYSQPCAVCGSMENQSIDHIIPFSKGGRYSIGNLQTLCLDCNVKKANRTMMEWRLGRIAKRNRQVA